VAASSQARMNQSSPNASMYLNLELSLITNTIKNFCKKYVTIVINNNLNLDAIARNSKAQSKMHQNTYIKHQNENATPIVCSRIQNSCTPDP
jgi:hypothetical protein